MTNLNDLRTYINTNFGPNGEGAIQGGEIRDALLELCDNMEARAGWQPVLATVTDGSRCVIKIVDYVGASVNLNPKPPTPRYLGTTGSVVNIADAIDIRGLQGPIGLQGLKGDKGDKGDAGTMLANAFPDTTFNAPAGDTVLIQNGSTIKRVPLSNLSPTFYLDSYNAAADGTTNDLTVINSTLAVIATLGGGALQFTAGKTYAINGPIVVGSNTRIVAHGARIFLKDNSNCNMLRSAAYVAGTGRTVNVSLEGGIWDRGTNGGVNNNNHALFFRQIDGLSIRDLKVITAPSVAKFAIAVGNCTYGEFRHLDFSTGSDAIHFTGPCTHMVVDDIKGTMGDDAVAVTTVDYPELDDTHGDVVDLRISNIEVNNATRAVLLGCTAYAIRDVTIQNVIQRGTGAGVTIGDGGITGGVVDRISISDLYGANVLVRHSGIGQITVNRATSSGNVVSFAREAVGGTCNVAQASLSGIVSTSGAAAVFADISVTIARLSIRDTTLSVGGLFSSNGCTVDSFTIRDCKVSTASSFADNIINLYGTFNRTLIDGCTLYVGRTTLRTLLVGGSSTVGSITYQGCTVSALDNVSGDLVYAANSAPVATINVANCTIGPVTRILQRSTGAAVTVVNLSNLALNGVNRIVESGSPVEINYSNIKLTSQVNNPFRTSNAAASMVIRGFGWSGYTSYAVVRSSTETIRVNAPDLPVDYSILTQQKGDQAYNMNSANTKVAPIGPFTHNGFALRFPLREPSLLSVTENVSLTATGYTTLHTVPAGTDMVVTRVVVRTTAASGITAPATVEVVNNGTGQVFSAQALTGLTGANLSFDLASTTAKVNITSATACRLNVTTAATGTSQTAQIELYGYYTS